ncbi:phospholipase D-like domain-containing protein [Roseivirga spongicola]|uniref:Phospholipase D-like domain-containing protein n=1 Tax=Roseivirga spongicola TaxID=333140 RepID=A0A150XF32_9BACT|nr:phospholipase D-like domain-containing protein [Roseivirga spongicola]KYG77320.1 hypothetical protein AWW68_00705 [Roseivirga spongicola]WPZ11021.1 phospholipase D-like domain-containing protein [Roseivirga spongicola]
MARDDVFFFTQNELVNELEKLIIESKKELWLFTPYINLNQRFEYALRKRIDSSNWKVKVLCRSVQEKDFALKSQKLFCELPNIEIRSNENLHAKVYVNDFDILITSMNLYSHSILHNIEFGVKIGYNNKGIIGNPIESLGEIATDTADLISRKLLGKTKIGVDPFKELPHLFRISKPEFKKENGVIIEDNLPTGKLSATKLSKKLGISKSDFDQKIKSLGLVDDKVITSKGKSAGLSMRVWKKENETSKYIVYPEDLDLDKSN